MTSILLEGDYLYKSKVKSWKEGVSDEKDIFVNVYCVYDGINRVSRGGM